MKILAFIFLFFSFQAKAEIVDKIVARVNDEVITRSDVTEALKNLERSLSVIKDPAEKARKRDAFKKDVVMALVNEKILVSAIDKENIEISDDSVDRALSSLAGRHQTTIDGLKARMAEQGVSYEEYRKQLARELKKEEFFKKVIYPRIRIADFDLEDYYKKHTSEFTGYDQIRFLEILLTKESVSGGESVDALSNRLVTELRRGKNFQETAKKYSRGPFAPQGGDSGLISTSEMRPDLVGFLLNLSPGEISDPVTTPGGVLIFKLLDRKNPKPRPFNDVKELVRQKLASDRVVEEVENYIRELRQTTFVEIK